MGNPRVDKLFCNKLNENSNDRHRRTFAYTAAGNNLEAVESTEETARGIAETWDRKDIARQTAYMGDHYQWVVKKTCVVRAISKEKLSQAGLVSCLDYYQESHALKFC